MANRLSPEMMVKVRAIAPFELALALQAWTERARADADAAVGDRMLTPEDETISRGWCDGYGPPCPLASETARDFGERAVAAIDHFMKEI